MPNYKVGVWQKDTTQQEFICHSPGNVWEVLQEYNMNMSSKQVFVRSMESLMVLNEANDLSIRASYANDWAYCIKLMHEPVKESCVCYKLKSGYVVKMEAIQ